LSCAKEPRVHEEMLHEEAGPGSTNGAPDETLFTRKVYEALGLWLAKAFDDLVTPGAGFPCFWGQITAPAGRTESTGGS